MLEIMRGISKVYGWPDVAPEAKDLIDMPSSILSSYVGNYGPVGGGIFYEVAMSGEKLAIRIIGNAVLNELTRSLWTILFLQEPGETDHLLSTATHLVRLTV